MIPSNVKKILILIIVVSSIGMGLKLSGFFDNPPARQAVNIKEAEKIFENALHNTKTMFSFSAENFGELVSLYNEIISVDGVNTLYYLGTKSSAVSVLEISDNVYNEIMYRLRDLPGLENEKSGSITIERKTIIDYDKHIEHNSSLLQRYQERLNNQYLTTREINELRNEINTIQTKIDSLNTLKSEQERESNLVMAVFRSDAGEHTPSGFNRYLLLALNIVLSFILITILALLLFFGIQGLAKLMEFMGIKSPKMRSIYHRYASRYSRYGYSGSLVRKRKKKHEKKDNDESSQKSD
jgi:hypothetical protein